MLIDIKRKLIFVAGIKTASTSIERLLEKRVDIRIVRSEWGKHDSLAEIQQKYAWLFQRVDYTSFFKWGVVRDPSDWLWSIYSSHSDEKFASNPNLYTGDISFDEFLGVWCRKNAGQIVPQHKRFLGESGQMEANLLIPLDMLHLGLQLVAPKYGVDISNIPELKVSHKKKTEPEERQKMKQFIQAQYTEDLALFERAQTRMKLLESDAKGGDIAN